MGKTKKNPQASTAKKISKREQVRQLQKIIANANVQIDPLSTLPPAFLNVPLLPALPPDNNENNVANSNNNDTSSIGIVHHYTSQTLPPNILKQCLHLFERNMGDMYKQSKWGLNMNEKLKELQHCDARFLVITTTTSSPQPLDKNNDSSPAIEDAADTSLSMDGERTSSASLDTKEKVPKEEEEQQQQFTTVIGFAHFRYEPNDEELPTHPITYLYELQIHPSYQRKHKHNIGLGKKLMTLIEILSIQQQMNRVMLTVFNYNVGAMKFYERMKYVIDEDSPSNFVGGESCDYEILSKTLA